jgi:hypothetical protein
MCTTHRGRERFRLVQAIWPSALIAALLIAGPWSTPGQAQAPWRDGSLDSDTRQLDDWREANRRQQQRDRVLTDHVRDLQATERQWQSHDRGPADGSSTLRLFPAQAVRPQQGRR